MGGRSQRSPGVGRAVTLGGMSTARTGIDDAEVTTFDPQGAATVREVTYDLLRGRSVARSYAVAPRRAERPVAAS
jgi:hypothetical protein